MSFFEPHIQPLKSSFSITMQQQHSEVKPLSVESHELQHLWLDLAQRVYARQEPPAWNPFRAPSTRRRGPCAMHLAHGKQRLGQKRNWYDQRNRREMSMCLHPPHNVQEGAAWNVGPGAAMNDLVRTWRHRSRFSPSWTTTTAAKRHSHFQPRDSLSYLAGGVQRREGRV